MITRTIAALLTVGLASAAEAQEQQTIEKQVEAQAGEPVQLGIFTRITPECTIGEHEVRVAAVAENGTITRKAAKVKAGKIPQCPDLSPEVALFFYQSSPGFTGTDRMEIRVDTPEKTQHYRYEVTVK